MRKTLSEAAGNSSVGFPMPAPVGGWNARDSITAMPARDAVLLDNWFPSTTSVVLRSGSTLNASLPLGSIPSPRNIKTLLNVAKGDGTSVRFAAADDGFYNITAGGTIVGIASAATTGKWEHVNLSVGGVGYAWCCAGDGVNKSRIYNSSTGVWTLLDGASAPILTGPVSANVTNVSLWKNRLILCIKDSLSFFVGPLNSVGGVFTEFPLGMVFRKGGFIVATANWTIDAGNGPDDRFVVITSEGEMAVYAGTDPTIADKFSLVGVYAMGKPVSKRCFVPLAGDVGLLADVGLIPLSRALQSATIDTRSALTDKIQQAFNLYYNNYKDEFGWQPVLLTGQTALVVNIPLGILRSYQFVMNTITGSWCRFTGWNAECLMVSEGKLYYALGNKVYRAWEGKKDDNRAITAIAKTAYSYGTSKSRISQVKLVKPVMTSDTSLTLGLALYSDFADGTSVTGGANFQQSVSRWDTAVYDTAIWSDGNTTVNSWRSVNHKPGKAFSLVMRLQTKDISATWHSTDYIAENGSLL